MPQNKELIKYEEMQKMFEKNRERYSIEELRDICSNVLSCLNHQVNGSITGFSLLVDIFQENEKKKVSNVEYNHKVVKVPQFIAEWIEKCKKNDSLGECLNGYYSPIAVQDDVVDWMSNNDNDLKVANAWLDGYEVEEEPKCYIKVGDKLYFKNWGEDRTCSVFEIDDAPGGVTGIQAVDLQKAEMTAGIIGGTVEEVNHG